MNKIKAYIGYDEETNTYIYENFEIIDKLPKVLPEFSDLNKLIENNTLINNKYNDIFVEVKDVYLDTEQPREAVWDYNYYKAKVACIADYHKDKDENKSINDYIYYEYLAVEKKDEDDD